ncbi:MAG: hypothetical protein WC374_06350 [Phycisphaerae bacterium]|jgi:hypothetical protein
MEKTVNLKNDEVFRHSVSLNQNRNYTAQVLQRAETAREMICDLLVQGKLDTTDLKIIAARDCSPMPSQSEVSRIIKVKRRTVCQRIARFKRLFARVHPVSW